MNTIVPVSDVPCWFHENLESIVRLVRRRGLAGLKKNRFSEVLVRGNEEGSPTAKYLLGLLYEYLALRVACLKRGDGVSLILQSAGLGYRDAMEWCTEHITAFFIGEDMAYRPYIVDMCEVAAKGGDARAQFMYSMILIEGDLVARDEAMSDYWLKKALAQGFDWKEWMGGILKGRNETIRYFIFG